MPWSCTDAAASPTPVEPDPCHHSPVFAEVVALPPDAPDAMRPGARFQLTEEAPLRVGRSSRCRLQVDVLQGADLLIGRLRGEPKAWTEKGLPVACSLNGQTLDLALSYALADGDHLVFSTGLVLAVRERPLQTARHEGLEAALAVRPDDAATLAVYMDFLKEHGDPLGDWLASDRRSVEAERFKVLGPLSESARTQAVQPSFSAAGLLTSVRVARHAVVGAPGLFWHLAQLGTLPVARTLSSLTIDYVVGTPAKRVLAPRGTPGWPKEPPPELVVPAVVELVGEAAFANTLEHLSLGLAVNDLELPKAVAARARERLPRLEWSGFVERTRSACLELVSCPEGVSVYPGFRMRLAADTRLGAATASQVIVRGPKVPEQLCRIVRRDEGWVVFDDLGVALLRVNGRATPRATLEVGDLIEPLPGLVLRFAVTLEG
ncbi:MAG: hypothetical protein JNJ54_14510 [Myxococcaceae bacterium]|nr:hypothetical protein [Myxococcaceae bacterium]